MAPTSFVLVVGAAILDDLAHPTRLLGARRTSPPELAGGWELPGGKVEAGEAPQDALRREVREELGVDVELGPGLLGPQPGGSWPLGAQHRMLVWLAVVRRGIPVPLEAHDEVRWLTAADLYAVRWLPADLPVVRALAPRLRG